MRWLLQGRRLNWPAALRLSGPPRLKLLPNCRINLRRPLLKRWLRRSCADLRPRPSRLDAWLRWPRLAALAARLPVLAAARQPLAASHLDPATLPAVAARPWLRQTELSCRLCRVRVSSCLVCLHLLTRSVDAAVCVRCVSVCVCVSVDVLQPGLKLQKLREVVVKAKHHALDRVRLANSRSSAQPNPNSPCCDDPVEATQKRKQCLDALRFFHQHELASHKQRT